MASLLPTRKRRLILDIGTSAVRVCELARTKTGYQVAKYVQQEYNGDPAQDEGALKAARSKALEEALKRAKVRHRATVFAVPGQSVFTRTRMLPPVPEYKVNQIVKYEIQQQIPFSLDQIAMDYQILSRSDAGGYEVMMAAIKVDVVDKFVDIVQGLRKSVDTVDVSPLAAYNWLKHTGEFGTGGECVALIDIGATTTDIVIEREGQFRFTRPLNIGGNDVTQALASAFGLNFSDADRLKRERGFAPTGDAERDGKGGEVIGKVLQRFSNEVLRSFAYFRSLPGGGQVSRVVLCGGGACLRNIVPYMQRQLGIDVRIAQPLAGLAIAPGGQQANDHPEQAAVVLGLALRTLQSVPIEINLIPPRVLEAARRREQLFYWTLSLVTLALIMASIIPDSENKNRAVKQRIETVKRFIAQYDPEVASRLTGPGATAVSSSDLEDLKAARSAIKTYQDEGKLLDDARLSSRFWMDEIALLNETRLVAGRMWFCSIETSSLGGGGAAAPAQSGGRNRPAGGRERPNLFSAGAGVARGGGGQGINKQRFPGFPGIGPSGAVSAAGDGAGRGRLRGGAPAQRGAQGAGGGKAGQAAAVQMSVPRARALIVYGYAESDATINTFVDTLRNARRTLPTQEQLTVHAVDFSEASVEVIDPSELWNAPCGSGAGGQRSDQNFNPEAQQSMYSFAIAVTFRRGEESMEDPKPAGGQGAGGPARRRNPLAGAPAGEGAAAAAGDGAAAGAGADGAAAPAGPGASRNEAADEAL